MTTIISNNKSSNVNDENEDLSFVSKKRKFEEISNTFNEPTSEEKSGKKKKQENPMRLDTKRTEVIDLNKGKQNPSQTNQKSFKQWKQMSRGVKVDDKSQASELFNNDKVRRGDSVRIDITDQSQDQAMNQGGMALTQGFVQTQFNETTYSYGNEGKLAQKIQRNATSLQQQFDNNLNLKSDYQKPQNNLLEIIQIDQNLVQKAKDNKQQKFAIAEEKKYLTFNELPTDWSLKSSLEVSCQIRSEKENIGINVERFNKNLQYYVYQTDQKMNTLDNITDKEQMKLAIKIQWMKSFRDVYKKFLHSAQDSQMIRGIEMPFFYVRNNNFCALFQIDSEGNPIAVVNPSKALAAVINEMQIQKLVQNICHDEQEEEEERQQREQLLKDDEPEEQIDDEIAQLLADQPEDLRTFNLVKKDETQLFTFKDKEVQAIYNVLVNFIANLMDNQLYTPHSLSNSSFAQIIAPSPFVNCTYNECQTFYNGNVAYANKQYKYQMKLYGIIFPHYLQTICNQMKTQIKKQLGEEYDKDIEIALKSDDQSKIFSHKKSIKLVKFNAKNGNNYRLMFA